MLVELLGRCAIDAGADGLSEEKEGAIEASDQTKSDTIRTRSILRSLVSFDDLLGILSMRFLLPIPTVPAEAQGTEAAQPKTNTEDGIIWDIINSYTFYTLYSLSYYHKLFTFL